MVIGVNNSRKVWQIQQIHHGFLAQVIKCYDNSNKPRVRLWFSSCSQKHRRSGTNDDKLLVSQKSEFEVKKV